MKLTDENVSKILLKNSYISSEDLNKAEKASKDTRISVLDYLYKNDLITKDLLGQAISESFNVPYFDLNSKQPDREVVTQLPEDLAKNLRVVLYEITESKAYFTTDSPENMNSIGAQLSAFFPEKEILISYSLPDDIDQTFLFYRKSLETRFSQIVEQGERVAPNILNQIFEDALLLKASDIHCEPQEDTVIVRFRVDGVLQEAGNLDKTLYENVLNRIKILSRLRIDEHFAAQDGAIRFHKDDFPVDLRVSITPTLDGEKVVIRVLSAYLSQLSLADLGLSEKDQETLKSAARKPFGMILATGPTGSGKTTTLYSLIRLLNKPDVNITTIEDPVEYKVPLVNQIQVNNATNLTFAKGLRSIVRQDPDVILVGEIRDLETADIAVNAALTGHLMLSSFHANDASTTIPRMLDMGIEPFLLASTLELIVAQRLVRRICNSCVYSIELDRDKYIHLVPELNRYFGNEKVTLYAGKGCPVCNGTGYKGRVAIYEFIQNSPELQDLILKVPSDKQIWEVASKQGSTTMFEDGILKVKKGLTTLDEILRVATPPSKSRLTPEVVKVEVRKKPKTTDGNQK